MIREHRSLVYHFPCEQVLTGAVEGLIDAGLRAVRGVRGRGQQRREGDAGEAAVHRFNGRLTGR